MNAPIFSNVTAGDLMNRDVFKVRADWSVHQLAEFLNEKRISGAPVVDEKDKLVGVVSDSDIVRSDSEDCGELFRESPHELYVHGWESSLASSALSSLLIEEDHEHFVRDIMSTTVLSVNESTPLSDISSTMIRHKVHRLLVTSRSKLVGVITAMDLVALVHRVSCSSDRLVQSPRSRY